MLTLCFFLDSKCFNHHSMCSVLPSLFREELGKAQTHLLQLNLMIETCFAWRNVETSKDGSCRVHCPFGKLASTKHS